MKHFVVFLSVAMGLLSSFPTAAQNRPEGRGFGQGNSARPPAPQRVPVRDAAAEGRNAANRPMQMTPEQRQQLRRDVHDHGRDIYRERGKGGRRR